jgi:DNA replication protein DnaC
VDPRSLTSLALGDWVEAGYSLLISGPTGAGKSWVACALAQYACQRGHSALYLRMPRLLGNGGFTKWLLHVARIDVLLLDDRDMAPLDAMVEHWHG